MTKQKKIYLKPVKNNNYGLFHIIFCYFDRGITLTRMTTTKIEVLLLRFQLVHLVQNVCTHCEALLYFVLEEKWENPDVNLAFAFYHNKMCL